LGGMVAALLVTLSRWGTTGRAFRDMIVLDNFALFFNVVICYATALILLLSMDYLRRSGNDSAEYWALVLFATAGMMLLAAAGDLVVVFLGLELMSLSLYVLAGFFKRELASGEAALKYFLLGAFASSFLLYGIALIYGAAGTTSLDRIALAMAGRTNDPLFVIGLGLLLVGFGFKISSVPFHMWAPDVYQAAPTSVTALIATGSKAAAFAVITLCERARAEAVDVADYTGLARRHPMLAAVLALFLLSLIGIPPLAGFVGKFYLFGAAVRAGYFWLAVIGVLNSAVAAYYYLRVVVLMYMREPEGAATSCVPSFASGLALTIALLAIVLLGVIPAPFADLAQAAVAPLLR